MSSSLEEHATAADSSYAVEVSLGLSQHVH